jgi:hypothetical protein
MILHDTTETNVSAPPAILGAASSAISSALTQLRKYVERENFKGYDPYDILNCPFDLRRFGKWPPILATQFQKRSPLNFRPLLGIKKDYNPKALGLFLTAYSNLAQLFPHANFENTFDFLLSWLRANLSKGFSGACWGYNFDWASPQKYLPRFAPSVVVTGMVGKGLFDYFKLSGNQSAFELLEASCQFILRDLPRTRTRAGIIFSYTPFAKDGCFNASLLGAEILAKVYSVTGETKLKELARAALDFVVAHQKEDGRWNYSIDFQTGRERAQIDFHQGYALESIYEIIRHLNLNDRRYLESLRKGAEFYRRQQFFAAGQAKWRLPRVWPVDIHNQAQGVITFSKLGDIDRRYLPFAKTIAHWTIEHMQDAAGYFYYRRSRFFTNKISYMRWSQAWMMAALSVLLLKDTSRS